MIIEIQANFGNTILVLEIFILHFLNKEHLFVFIILKFLQCIKVHDFILPLKLYNQPQIWIVKDQKCFCFIQNLKTLCPNHNRYNQDQKNNFETEIWCEVNDEFQYNVAMPR